MIQFDLTDTELNVLREALEAYLSDLRVEIADTDNLDFRNTLKAKQEVLDKVVQRIKAGTAGGAPS